MNLDTFKNESLNQGSVSKYTTDGNSWKDGGFLGQCVSEVNQYCWRVLGVPAGAWGDAKDWPSNATVLSYFDKVSSPQAGDIGVLGSNYGGGYGHIWIYLSANTILEQNGAKALRVSTGNAYNNPIAILRKKGGSSGGDDDVTWKEAAEKAQAVATELQGERDRWKATAEELQGLATQSNKERDDWKAAAEKVQAIATQLQNELDSDDAKKKLEQIKQIVG